jgi:hypothetical protein
MRNTLHNNFKQQLKSDGSSFTGLVQHHQFFLRVMNGYKFNYQQCPKYVIKVTLARDKCQ